MTALKLTCEDRDGTALVTIAGDLDIYSAPRLREMLLTFTGDGTDPVPLVVDLDACTFLDAVGAAVLVGAAKRQEARGAQLAVACTAEDVLRVIRTLGLLAHLRVCGSVDEALAVVSARTEHS
ncbi:MAG TPA: STAS domain-containing protein [Streptosporangiaceae bacterium]|nr:STAS domain-containing protein [Streptosporangiaceae bacterium]